jgi:hypothetical protein
MSKLPRTWVAACAIACLAIAVPGIALAQENRNRDSGEQGRQSDRQSDDDRDRDQRESDERDRDQQDRSRDDQSGRRTSDSRDSDQAALGIALSRDDDDKDGARVERVFRNSPAEEMGLREGDRIISVNGEKVESNRDLMREIRDLDPRDEVELEIKRDGDERELSGKLESRREAFVARGQRDDQRRMTIRRSWSDRGDRGQYSQRQDHQGYTRGQDSRGSQDVRSQIDSLERQVQQIQRQLENLRVAVDGRGQRTSRDDGRESTAGYEEYDSGQRTGQRTSYDRGWDGYERNQSQRPEDHPSPGGEIGGSRQRPGIGFND